MHLRELRENRGLTVEALALMGGCDRASISRIERGLQKPSPALVARLAKALGISAYRLNNMLHADSGPLEELKA